MDIRTLIIPLYIFSGIIVFGQTYIPTWDVFDELNSPLPNNTIRSLLVDKENDLWIGTDNGLAHLSNSTWVVYDSTNSGLTSNYIRGLAVDSDNNIWIGTVFDGVLKFDGTTWENYNTSNSDIVDNFIKTISVDKNDNKWIGTVEGICYFNDTIWKTWTIANSGIFTNNIQSIGIGNQNEKFIGTINGGLIYFDADTNLIGEYHIANSMVPDNSAMKVKVDSLGNPWYAGSAGGLFVDNGNQTWTVFDYENSAMPTNSLTTMELDSEFNFYLGSQLNGLIIRRHNQDWENYTSDNSGLIEDYILSIVKDETNQVWIGTYSKGLVKLTENVLNVNDISEGEKLVIYPNPVSSSSILKFNHNLNNATLSVISLDGRKVHFESCKSTVNSIRIPDIASGTYFLNIQSSKFNSLQRLIIAD